MGPFRTADEPRVFTRGLFFVATKGCDQGTFSLR